MTEKKAAPCADCKTTGGYTNPREHRVSPVRRSGRLFGIEGVLCRDCYAKRYSLHRGHKPRAPKPPRARQPIADPLRYEWLVVVIAREYRNRGVDTKELIARGQLGLVEACWDFDPNRHPGIKFSTFAKWPIRKAVLKALDERSREPAGESRTRLEAIVDYRDNRIAHIEVAADVASLMRNLTRQQADVVRLRYGLDGHGERTSEEIGLAIGTTKQTASQYVFRAMGRLRAAAHVPEPRRASA